MADLHIPVSFIEDIPFSPDWDNTNCYLNDRIGCLIHLHTIYLQNKIVIAQQNIIVMTQQNKIVTALRNKIAIVLLWRCRFIAGYNYWF